MQIKFLKNTPFAWRACVLGINTRQAAKLKTGEAVEIEDGIAAKLLKSGYFAEIDKTQTVNKKGSE